MVQLGSLARYKPLKSRALEFDLYMSLKVISDGVIRFPIRDVNYISVYY